MSNIIDKNKLDEKKVYNYSLVFLIAGFFLGWMFKLQIIQLITLIIYVGFILLNSFNAFLMAPILLVGLFSLPEFFYFDTIPIVFILEICGFLLGCIGFVIKNIIYKKITFSFGGIGKSFLFLGITVLLSTIVDFIFVDGYFDKTSLFVVSILSLMILVYLFFNIFKDTLPDNYLSNIFFGLNILIIVQIAYLCLTQDLSIHKASMALGWSISYNVFSMALEFIIPFVFLIYMKNTKRFDILIMMLIDILLIACSKSRTGLGIGVVYLILLYIYFINALINKNTTKKEKIHIILFTSLISVGVFFFLNSIISSVNRIIKEGLNLTGRDEVWDIALGYFSKNFLFGGGIQALFELQEIRVPDNEGLGLFFCHNTFITILCVGGLSGFICFIYHVFEMFKTTFSLDKYNKLAFLLFLFVGFGHGLVDNTYFSIEYMIPYLVIFSACTLTKKTIKSDRKKQ